MRAIRQMATLALALGLTLPALVLAQTNNYAKLVAQAQADLKAGNGAQALLASQKAIKMDPRRWEAYVVAGGALEVEEHYTEAVEDFTRAMDRAPSERKAAVKGLLEKCMKAQIAAESKPAAAPAAAPQSAPEQAVSQAEVVLWKTIQNSTNPNDFKAYLQQYPNGAFAALARDRLDRMQAARRLSDAQLEKLSGAWKAISHDCQGQASGISWLEIGVDAPKVTFQWNRLIKTISNTRSDFSIGDQWRGVGEGFREKTVLDGDMLVIEKKDNHETDRFSAQVENGRLKWTISEGPLCNASDDYVRISRETARAEMRKYASLMSVLKAYIRDNAPQLTAFAPNAFAAPCSFSVTVPKKEVETAGVFGVGPLTVSGRAIKIGVGSIAFSSQGAANHAYQLITEIGDVCTAGLK